VRSDVVHQSGKRCRFGWARKKVVRRKTVQLFR
jgi:hypothetical protein